MNIDQLRRYNQFAMVLRRTLFAVVALLAIPAQARFGKAGSSSAPAGSSSAPPAATHAAAPVATQGSGPSGQGQGTSGRGVPPGRFRAGYYSGAYVPSYGYGYGYGYGLFGPYATLGMSPWLGLSQPPEAMPEPATLRITAGVQASIFVAGESGVTLGVHGHLEGERWGVVMTGQNIAVRALDGSGAMDNLQQAQARVTFAFLTGRYGRLRAELGADAIFAPNLTAVGPSGALAGSLWIVGPLALEGSVLVTPYPFWQLDYQAGLAVGLGPVGLRAGWRTQVLDDRGLADGVVHRDVFMGPYVGVAVVF